MTSNTNRSPIAGTGKSIRYAAALTLAVVAGLGACQTSPAEPAPAAALQAETPSEDHRSRGPMANALFRFPEELELSADQQAEVERIRAELSEKNEPLREQIRATLGISADDSPRRLAFREMTEDQREAVRPAVDQLRENHRVAREQVLAVLTADQRATLDSLRAERAARWAERRTGGSRARGLGGPPFAGRMLRLPSELELTADQQTELERTRAELRE
ncbi:MAG: Spy/CpxP family protein refolding chaperone, partial [Longimicrobiales bacterium]